MRSRIALRGRNGRGMLRLALVLATMLSLAGCRTWDHHHGHGGHHHYHGHHKHHSSGRHHGWSRSHDGWGHRGRYESPSYARPGPPVGRSLGSSFKGFNRSR